MTTLQSLSQHSILQHFELFPFDPKEKLTADVASALFTELPTSCAASVSSFIESEIFYKRACSQVARLLGCRREQHGLSYKRMFFEMQIPDLLNKMRISPSIAENIFTLKMSCAEDFPLDEVCSHFPNLNRIDIKYAVAISSKKSRVERMPRALHMARNLVSLTVQDSFLTDADVEVMFSNEDCTSLNTILHLNLRYNKITSIGLALIVKYFVSSSSSILASLDLMGNRIGGEGGSLLARDLTKNESLLTLNLRLNNIGDDFGSDLLNCLRSNTTLRSLNLSANNLGSRSANALVALFESNNSLSLETVTITSNAFTDEDEEAIKSCKQCFLDPRSGTSSLAFNSIEKSLMPF